VPNESPWLVSYPAFTSLSDRFRDISREIEIHSELLFNIIFQCHRVPAGFRYSYIVPEPKVEDCRSKAMTHDDFRAISITPILSKVFEYCILDRYSTVLMNLNFHSVTLILLINRSLDKLCHCTNCVIKIY